MSLATKLTGKSTTPVFAKKQRSLAYEISAMRGRKHVRSYRVATDRADERLLFVVVQIEDMAPPPLIIKAAEARQTIASSRVYSIRSCPSSSRQKRFKFTVLLLPVDRVMRLTPVYLIRVQ